MESKISKALKLQKYAPVGIYLSNEKPDGAFQFEPKTRGCAVSLLVSAAQGKIAVADSETTGCPGGKIGLGFSDDYSRTPGGIEYFLSTGYGEGYPEGEGYKKTPELAKAFVQQLPKTVIDKKYVVFRPLTEAEEPPLMVCFLVNPDQLSALIVLANYGKATSDNVRAPFSAGCHSFFLLPLAECNMPEPKAVLGLTDITARKLLDADRLSFTVPWSLFLEMEANVPSSFLDKHDWQEIKNRINK